jgi:hypothetical protein
MKAKEVMSKYNITRRTLSNCEKWFYKSRIDTGRVHLYCRRKNNKTKTWHHIIIITPRIAKIVQISTNSAVENKIYSVEY